MRYLFQSESVVEGTTGTVVPDGAAAVVLVMTARCLAKPPATSHAEVTVPVIPSSNPLLRCLPVCTVSPGLFAAGARVLERSSRYNAPVNEILSAASHFAPASRLTNFSGSSAFVTSVSDENWSPAPGRNETL